MKRIRLFVFLVSSCVLTLALEDSSAWQATYCVAQGNTCTTFGEPCPENALPSCEAMCQSRCGTNYAGTWPYNDACGGSGPLSGCPSGKQRFERTCNCFCQNVGNACDENSDCCSGYCNTNGLPPWNCAEPPPPPECGGYYESCGVGTDGCCEYPYECVYTEQGEICQEPVESPILINLANNSSNYQLTSVVDGVLFDINADGDLERVSWTEAQSQVAFLVLDRSGNGLIDNGEELFGNISRMRNGQRAANGFEALKDLDGGNSSDGVIDVNDSFYSSLRVWLDRNHDGNSQSGELLTLRTVGVTAISTDYRIGRRRDKNGNHYKYVGEAWIVRGGQPTPVKVFDVFLSISQF